MAAITLRSVKGSALTNAEVDANFTNLNTELVSKQDALVSGTSIKTVNGQSVLGSGNIQIDGGVVSFNTRTGAITLTSGDVTGALGFTPINKAGDTFTGDVVIDTKLAVGTSITASTNYRFGKGITGGVSSSAFVQNGNVQSDVTTTAVSFNSQANTAAAAFTLSNYFHYYAQQGVLGSGSAITTITGFYADNTLAGSSTTYGFRGGVGSGTGKWNLYMDGSASNYMAGRLGIGTTSLTADVLRVTRAIDGGVNANGVLIDSAVNSDVTTRASLFRTVLNTQAAAFTLATVHHYEAAQNASLGAGSAITTQSGFTADSTLTGATNNFGFRGRIAAGTGRWNLYMDGTASNHLAGPLGINTTFLNDYLLRVGGNMSGAATRGAVEVNSTAQSDVTSEARGIVSAVSTAAASFTVGQAAAFFASQGTVGAGSTITTQVGFLVGSAFTGGATNNYGFRGAIASGSGRWNLFMDGTAANFLAGGVILNNNLGVGTSGSPSYGTSGQVLTSQGPGVAPTWTTVSGGGSAGQILETAATITSNYTIQAGNNGFSVGPVTIQSGVSVTVPAGRTWLVAQTTTPSGITSGRAVAMAIVFGA